MYEIATLSEFCWILKKITIFFLHIYYWSFVQDWSLWVGNYKMASFYPGSSELTSQEQIFCVWQAKVEWLSDESWITFLSIQLIKPFPSQPCYHFIITLLWHSHLLKQIKTFASTSPCCNRIIGIDNYSLTVACALKILLHYQIGWVHIYDPWLWTWLSK